MLVDIVFPEFAEDGDEKAKLLQWNVEKGQSVEEGDELLELLTDKATFTVPSPCKGILSEQNIAVGEEIAVNAILGKIEKSEG